MVDKFQGLSVWGEGRRTYWRLVSLGLPNPGYKNTPEPLLYGRAIPILDNHIIH
jgi:hypothetical protein